MKSKIDIELPVKCSTVNKIGKFCIGGPVNGLCDVLDGVLNWMFSSKMCEYVAIGLIGIICIFWYSVAFAVISMFFIVPFVALIMGYGSTLATDLPSEVYIIGVIIGNIIGWLHLLISNGHINIHCKKG